MHSNKIKLLYLGAFGKHCSDKYRVKGFEEFGMFDLFYLDFRVLYRDLGNRMIDTIKQFIKNNQIQFILINKGEIFTPGMIFELYRLPVYIYYWYGDMRDELAEFVKNNVEFYDAVMVNAFDENYTKMLKDAGAKKVLYSHTATDIDTFKRYENSPLVNDVAFFGGNYDDKFRGSKFRTNIINRLKNEIDIKFSVYGNNWGFGKPIVYGDDFSRVASSSTMLLSISNYEDVHLYTSNRLWNSMACGMTLVHRFNGIDKLFKDGEEVVIFDSYEDLIDKIRYYKNKFDEVKRIFENGRRKIKFQHTYKKRAEEMFNHMSRELK